MLFLYLRVVREIGFLIRVGLYVLERISYVDSCGMVIISRVRNNIFNDI